jgi:hypothetical protein
MAFLQAPEGALDQLALLQLPCAHAATQTPQIADEFAQPAAAHGAFLLHATRAAAEHIDFVGFGDQLDLHFGGDLLPVAGEELLFVGLELMFGRAHEVMRAALAEEFKVVVADDAAVKDPEAAGLAELRLDGVEDVFERGAVEAVAGEEFVSEGETLGRDQCEH